MTKLRIGSFKDRTERKALRALFSLLAIGVMIFSLSLVGTAQELAATLTGTVTDASGAVVANATITVHNDDTGTDAREVPTSNTGSFNITNLAAGRYTVTVKNGGFQTYVAKGVILNVAEKHTLDVQLATGKVAQTVEVTAENTPIQTTTAEAIRNGHRRSGARTGTQ